MAVLLKEGVDPLAQEEHEGNILHLLVFLAAENLKPEDKVLQIYNTLMGILSLENKRTLLLRAMFDTNGVYRVSELDTGMIKYIQYDITEYETHVARLKKSPLYMYVCTYVHTCIHTYIHTYICSRNKFATPIDEKALKPL